MKFSVIIPTRNRPVLVKTAIESVMQQNFDAFEIIVVNDGSDTEYHDAYHALQNEFAEKLIVINLEQSLHGHGPSFVRNIGALQAKGKYLCFLDDDDSWIDANHLATAYNIMSQTNADVYFTNQQAYRNDRQVPHEFWLSPLEKKLQAAKKPLIDGTYQVSVAELINNTGFAHLNTTVTTKKLYCQIKGMDESIRYEEDLDFYYRLIDQAKIILFNPTETARHNIPDASKTTNMSTVVSSLEKKLYRLYLLNKAILFSAHSDIRRVAKKHKIYTLKNICDTLYKQQNYELAAYYAKEVVCIGFNLKWLAFTLFVLLKHFLKNFSLINQ